jgi:hypothetical protein
LLESAVAEEQHAAHELRGHAGGRVRFFGTTS